MTRVSFHTLGCRLNQAETALAADDLARNGYDVVPWEEEAEVRVINSCAVTGAASQKTRQAVRAARRQHPGCFMVVMGCDAKVDRGTWDGGDADLVVPHPYSTPLSRLLDQALAERPARRFAEAAEPVHDFRIEGAARFAERTRANLKIQDGCNFYCTYCIVPYTRGPARSRDLSDVLREARELIAAGYRELVLCGVNLTTYSSKGADLAELLVQLAALGDQFRIRLGSSEPGPVIPRVLEVMKKEPRICRFLHLPLQYGEDSILRRMHRHYNAATYAGIMKDAASEIPGICLGADVITGFPGENDDTFNACRKFMEELPFGLLHVFPYSPRPGTVAAAYPDQTPSILANQRAAILGRIAEQKAQDFASSQIGQVLQVLVEDESPAAGWTDNYLHATLDDSLPNNTLVKARVVAATGKRELRAEHLK